MAAVVGTGEAAAIEVEEADTEVAVAAAAEDTRDVFNSAVPLSVCISELRFDLALRIIYYNFVFCINH